MVSLRGCDASKEISNRMTSSSALVPVGTLSKAWQELVHAAQGARESAYAPYSGFAVGAAVRTSTGQIYTGVNIENASYGLTVCAERVAIWNAVTHGEPHLQALAVATENASMPCGACRQVMIEFARLDMPILAADTVGGVVVVSVGDLLPNSFSRADLQ